MAGADADITKSELKESIVVAKTDYTTLTDALVKANKIMDEIHTYWGGKLYNEIVTTWSHTYPMLQAFIKNAADTINFMCDVLKVYSTADSTSITVQHVGQPRLHGIENNDADRLDTTTSKMRTDMNMIVNCMTVSIDEIKRVFNKLIKAPAKSDAINRGKDFMAQNKDKIITGLENVSKVVKNNMTTAADGFDAAEQSVQNALK